jgi:hypothetical protein
MESSPSWEAGSCSATEEFPDMLRNPKVHKNLPLVYFSYGLQPHRNANVYFLWNTNIDVMLDIIFNFLHTWGTQCHFPRHALGSPNVNTSYWARFSPGFACDKHLKNNSWGCSVHEVLQCPAFCWPLFTLWSQWNSSRGHRQNSASALSTVKVSYTTELSHNGYSSSTVFCDIAPCSVI